MDFTNYKKTTDFVIENKPVTITIRVSGRSLYAVVDQIGVMGEQAELLAKAEKHGVDEIVELFADLETLSGRDVATYDDEALNLVRRIETNLVLIGGERYASDVQLDDVDEADFSKQDDIIDSRDIVARVELLKSALETAGFDTEDLDALKDIDPDSLPEDSREAFADIRAELVTLQAMCDDGENYGEEWRFGTTLVRESHFTDFAEEECESMGYIAKDFPSWIKVDWEATANNMKQDYTETDFDGVTYLFRT